MISILKEFGRGQVTLPKKWRDKFNTKVYIAKETSQGLLITPFTDDSIKIDEGKLHEETHAKHSSSFFRRKSIGKNK
jgi:bifunctional DNA-binding transcriptional regulator/antitoxin component of YhaV-PrlF toxin-antitoxin module